MTRDEIHNKLAGPEFDRLVAENVIGESRPNTVPDYDRAFTALWGGKPFKSPGGAWECWLDYEAGDVPTWEPRPFTTDIAIAWQMLEKLDAAGYTVEISNDRSNGTVGWYVDICTPFGSQCQDGCALDQSAPLAICRAALMTTLKRGDA